MISFLLVHHHGSKMLRSESNSSITQSPIGWQISHFLTLLHEPTSGMCVCTSERVLLVLVLVCTSVAVCVCERSSWMASPRTASAHNQLSLGSCRFSCMQLFVWVTSPAVTFSEPLFWDTKRRISSFIVSQHVTSASKLGFFCSSNKQTSIWKPLKRLNRMLSWYKTVASEEADVVVCIQHTQNGSSVYWTVFDRVALWLKLHGGQFVFNATRATSGLFRVVYVSSFL